jgi:hypothetical protein
MEKMICLELAQNLEFDKNSFTICNKCNSICDYTLIYNRYCNSCNKNISLFGKKTKIICFDIKSLILGYFKKNINKKSEIKFLKIEESLEIFTEKLKYCLYSKSNMCWYFATTEKNFRKIAREIFKIIDFFYLQNFKEQKYKGYAILKNELKTIQNKQELFFKISANNYEFLPEVEVSFPTENLNRIIFLKNLRENLNFWKFD